MPAQCASSRVSRKNDALATSPLTKLGFVRVSMQMPGLKVSLAVAQAALTQIRTARCS